MKAINTYLKIICLVFILGSTSLLAQWEQCNIPFYGKVVSDLAFKGDTIVAGTDNGVYLSTNNGSSWHVTGLKISINKVYIKGDNIIASTAQDGGLYLSSNNGNSWKKLDQTLSSILSFFDTGKKIITGSYNCSYISADEGYTWQNIEYYNGNNSLVTFNCFALCSNKILAGNNDGAYQSTDYGYTWTLLNIFGENFSVALFAKTDYIIYAGTYNYGLYKSTNNGNNWVSIINGLPNNIEIDLLAVKENKIFIWDYKNGLYLSLDEGKNWTNVCKEIPNYYIRSITISGNNLLVGTLQKGLYRSSDNGASWSKSNIPIVDNYFNFEINKFYSNGNKIFANSNYGLFSSDDNGDNWALSGFNVLNIKYLATNNKLIMASSGDSGYISTNNGDNWSKLAVKINNNTYPVIDNDTLYVANGGRVLYSTDTGKSWNNDGTDPDSITNTISAFALCEGRILASKLDGVYISKDKGLTWELSNNGLENNSFKSFSTYAHFIFGVSKNGLYLSTDYGSNWELLNNGLPSAAINCIAISENNLFAGTDGKGIWLSKDFGKSWNEINKGLDDRIINRIAVNGNLVFAATKNNGIYKSSDYGSSWKSANDDLDTIVNFVAMNNDFVFVGTSRNSLLKANINAFHSTLSVSAKQLTMSANANSSLTFDIVSDTNWTIDNDASWLNVNQSSGLGNGKITLTAPENLIIKPRNATITVRGQNNLIRRIFVSQEGAVRYLKVSRDTIKLDSPDSTSLTLDINSNTDMIIKNGRYFVKSNKQSDSGNTIVTITVEKNHYTKPREDQIRILWPIYKTKTVSIIQPGAAPLLSVSSESLTIGDSLDSKSSFSIISNANWTAQSSQNWLTMSSTMGYCSYPITLTALEENTTNISRTAKVTVTANGTPAKTIVITQKASANKLWKSCNGPNIYHSTWPIITKGDKVFACGDSVYLSTDNGLSWISEGLGSYNKGISGLALNDNNLYASTYNNGIYLSTNDGKEWVCITKNITDSSFANLSVIGNKIFASYYKGARDKGFYISTNGGVKWEKNDAGIANSYPMCFAACGSYIFAGTEKGIYKSTDEGETWVKDGLGTDVISSFAINGSDIFAGTYTGQIFHKNCNDTNVNWDTIFTYGQHYHIIHCLAISGNYIFAGTYEDGVLISTNNGKTWNTANSGLLNKDVRSLAISGNSIYAGIDYRTIFKASLNDFNIFIENIEKSKKNISLFPNPAQNTLNIRLDKESAVASSVRVLDVCGRTVAESQIPAGSKEFALDVKDLPIGMYLLNLVTGNEVMTEKFGVWR